MSNKRVKTKTISEKVAETFAPRSLLDPEIDSEDETAAKLAEIDEDVEVENSFSEIRKRNTKLLSEISAKYRGKVSSRREMEDQDEGSESDKEDEHEDSIGDGEESDYDSSENDSDYDNSVEVSDEGGDDGSDKAESEVSLENLVSESNQTAEIQKGLAVQNQLKMWEKLLEMRIQSQKMLIKSNSLPTPQIFNSICSQSQEFSSLAEETQQNLTSLLDNMLDIRQTLVRQYSETKDLATKQRKRKSQGDSNEPPVKRFAEDLKEVFDVYNPYRDSVLQKWHDRTKILAPGAGSKGSNKSASNFDVVRKIEAVLLNKSDLVKKSQTVKGSYQLFGEQGTTSGAENEENSGEVEGGAEKMIFSPEIYDDTDFYHQQLRELIEFKTNSTTDPGEMSKQFAELQKMRQKMKKKVDTRASKGRKIRYVVHNKMVNFMAPNPHCDWTEESRTELYRSLFAT